MDKKQPQKTIEELEKEKFEQLEIIKNADIVITNETKVIEALSAKKNRTISANKNPEQKEDIKEPISDEEYNDFVDNNNVSKDRLNIITEKIKNGEKLSLREQAIHSSKTSEIENKLREQKRGISEEDIKNKAQEIYKKRVEEGREGTQDSDWEQAEKELRETQENKKIELEIKDTETKNIQNEISPEEIKKLEELEIQKTNAENKLRETRESYIKEYKKCKNENNKQILINKTREATFNILAGVKNLFNKKDKINYRKLPKAEDYFNDKLKESKKEYDQARIEIGNIMFNQKKAELEKSGLSGEELEKALINYKATEILAKTIIDERQKIIDSRVQDPTRWKKLLDGYRKMPRWQRVAISTALFTAAAGAGIVTGGVFAGYGLATMATMKFGASMAMGAFVGQSVKGIDLVKKKSDLKFIETQYNKKTDLKDKFSKGEIELEEYEKEIETLESEEKKRARNRMLLKAGVGIALAGTAGFIAYDALGNGLSHLDSTHNTIDAVSGPDVGHIQHEPAIERPSVTPPIQHVNIEATADHGQGAISTLRELQHNLKAEYGDNLENAPASVKHILDTDAHKLAQEYGMYKPGQDAESAFIKSGSSFRVDESGNVTYHEVSGDNDITLEKGTEIKANTLYEGKMADTDHSATHEVSGDNNTIEQIEPTTGEPVQDGSDNLDNDQYKVPPQVDAVTGEPIDQATENAIASGIVESANLSEEVTKQIIETGEHNIEHLFPNDEKLGFWFKIKTIDASTLTNINESEVVDAYKPLVSYIHKLHEVTGLNPRYASIIDPTPENVTNYITRALQKAQEMGQLDKVKL